jgi:ring-1,2-phenylacetyl-CoA epoxidase subunit PaaA
VTLPDPNLRWNEAEQQYETSEIDWTEFFEVLAGRGPMNAERLRNRRNAHDDGAWVREAAAEYARKRASAPPPSSVPEPTRSVPELVEGPVT